MRESRLVVVAASLAAIFAPMPQGSGLSRRIAGAPDGLVKMTYASRPSICGDGRSFIAEGQPSSQGWNVWFLDGVSLSGSMDDLGARCRPGPVRLLLVVRDRRVIDVQPFVGPSSQATERAGTELGTVPAAEVAKYLLDLAVHGPEETSRNAILAASIADSVRVAGPLAGIARDKSLRPGVRETALKWVARVADREGDRDALRVTRTIAEDNDDQVEVRERAIRVIGEESDGATYLRSLFARIDEPTLRERIVRVVGESGTRSDVEWVRGIALDRNERTAIRERAVRMLGESSDSRSLRELYERLDQLALRERVIRVVAEIGDGESRRWLRELVGRSSEPTSLRERAIRCLAELGDVEYLRSTYGTLDDMGLRERVVRAVAEAGGRETSAWLREVALDAKQPSSLRERAVRSLAEAGAPTAELVSLYDTVADHTVRDRLVNILAERGDRAARDKLRAIAENDPDEALRRRAARKLAESR